MPISSLIVKTEPGRSAEVVAVVTGLPGITVSCAESDQLLAITDAPTEEGYRELFNQMEAIPGVISVNLVYHNTEDVTEDG